MYRILALMVGCGSSAPSDPAPSAKPEPAKPSGPQRLTEEPFAEATLATSSEPPFAVGKVRRVATVLRGPTVSVWGAFDAPSRVVVGMIPPGGKKPDRWQLLDVAGRKLADIAEPKNRLSERELVVSRNEIESIVRVADGSVIAPAPRLPIAGDLTKLTVLFAVGSDRLWLAATAGGHTYVGPWSDRSPTPTLGDEVPFGLEWYSSAIADGLEIDFGSRYLDFKCAMLRLRDHKKPQCVEKPPVANDLAVTTGTWNVEIVDAHRHPILAASDPQHGLRQDYPLPCSNPKIATDSQKTPRVVVVCDASDDKFLLFGAWTPGHVHVFPIEKVRVKATALADARVVSIASLSEMVPIGDVWLDVDAGVVLHGPMLQDTRLGGARFVVFGGTGAKRRAIVFDADAKSLRDVAAAPCTGELVAQPQSAHAVAVVCIHDTRPPNLDFAIDWTKLIDLGTSKAYELPGPVETVFGDGTALVSNRKTYADGIAASSELTLVSLTE